MKRLILTIAASFVSSGFAMAQVPSLINYQGRLTDSGGSAVTGTKNFAINIYDAATGGTLLYSETIGPVTLNSNGIYSFQFGASGTSNSQTTETIATTDGSTLTYSKALSNTSVVAESLTVTDGTNSWSQAAGNPGVEATATANTIAGFVIGATITNAGSGYTSAPAVTISGNGNGATATATISNGTVTGITITSAGTGYTNGATITIAPPVIPFRVDYNNGSITATYTSAPASGGTITATYRYGTSGITGALGSGAEHWMEVSVDGVAQTSRQRVLAVPFAQRADIADIARQLAIQTRVWRPAALTGKIVTFTGQTYPSIHSDCLPILNSGLWLTLDSIIPFESKKISNVNFDISIPNQSTASFSIVRYRADIGEQVLVDYSRTGSDSSNGRFTSNHPCSINIDSSFVYKIRLSLSGSKSAIINDIQISIEE